MLLILSGPSGAGKTSIMRALLERLADAEFSVSATTRRRTSGEVDGADYHFLTQAQFAARVQEDAFLEHAEYAGNRYGTLRAPIEDALRRGRIVILDIDVQGGRQVKRAMPDSFGVFILPPSREDLEERLRERKRDDEATIQRRLAQADREIADAKAGGVYDSFVTNNDLDTAIDEVMQIVTEERQRRAENAGV